MESLPAETLATAATAALAAPVAGDAVADAVDPAELLGIDVDQFAGLLPLVADDCHGRVESLEPAEPDPAQRLADRRDRPAEAARDRRPRQPLAPQDCDLGFGGGIEPERQECGRDERSPKPAAPSTRKRSRHLRTVLPSTPNADATAATVEPASRRSTISIRLRGVVLAFS